MTIYSLLPVLTRTGLSCTGLMVANLLFAQPAWHSKYDSVSTSFPEGFRIVYKKGKAGYADDKTGKELVPPKYDKAAFFSGGTALVYRQKVPGTFMEGMIDRTGKEIIPPVYDALYNFSEGVGIAGLNDKYGYIDKSGKKLTPLKYDLLLKISGGIGGGMLYDRNAGKQRYGFVDKTGREITAFKYDRILALFNGNGLAERDKQYFSVNKAGKETLLPYEKIGFEYYGRLLVQAGGKYGYINGAGEVVIPLQYENAWDFSTYSSVGWLAQVKKDKKYGFIDTSGREAVSLKYDLAGLFRDGLAKVCVWGPSKTAMDYKWGYVDSTGTEVLPLVYGDAGNFSEGLAPVKWNGKWGFVNKAGTITITAVYEYAQEFSEGLAPVKKNGKYGFVDKEGKEVIPCKYDAVLSGFRNRYAKVQLEGRQITIDATGRER